MAVDQVARRRAGCAAALVAVVTSLRPTTVSAEGQCHVVDLEFFPAQIASTEPMRAPSQLVAWVERTDGVYVDTIFITQQTGTYGLGNRPGRPDFNSGPDWPYGRRLAVFPVWAHRHGMLWPELVFQNGEENNLSHPLSQSSRDIHFCRPLLRQEPAWDTGTCASMVYTDKGLLAGVASSRYPPRQDITRDPADHASVDMFGMLNPFDAVSHATPPSDVPAQVTWPIPQDLTPGSYVMWVEVSREFDHNATYSIAARPSPMGIPWSDYGAPYRGQPSVVYKVPFTIGVSETTAVAVDYAGYGDPDGLDGNLRAPDGTITVGVMGSGAERLAIQTVDGTSYRVRVISRPEFDFALPGAPGDPVASNVTSTSATIEFTAPGDDGLAGKVKGYEVRYLANGVITEETFETGVDPRPPLTIGEPGTPQQFELTGLLYDTKYSVAIRAFDDCRNKGPLSIVELTTPERPIGEVDACFIATAAYGSVMAADVEMLRRFRDTMLQRTVLGELAIEAYYTFGPAVAGVIGESELLRATARAALDPIVATVRILR